MKLTAGSRQNTDMAHAEGETGSLVTFRDVAKTYDGETRVIDGLDLNIRRGEFLTLLGPSGSGKTTVLMMLAGFEAPTAGSIRVAGRDIVHVPPHRRGIGVVFQNYALFPHMTVGENLRFPLDVRGQARREAEEKVERALGIVRLRGFADRRPNQLSGGQQQRVALARALVFQPELVLLDEPLGALDKNLREEMQLELKHIHEELGVTMVYVTHDQSEALTMSDRIAVFESGEIQQVAQPDTLYQQPHNAFVAGFIGENNRLYGRIEDIGEGNRCRVRVDGTEAIVAAVDVNTNGAGSRTTLSLRPERVHIGDGAENADNVFDAEVRESIFMGDHIRVRAAACGSETFVVKMPNTQHRPELHVGDTVRIGWQAEDCRALDPA